MFSIELQDFAQIVILCHLFAFSPLVFISYDVTILLFQIAVTCLIPPWATVGGDDVPAWETKRLKFFVYNREPRNLAQWTLGYSTRHYTIKHSRCKIHVVAMQGRLQLLMTYHQLLQKLSTNRQKLSTNRHDMLMGSARNIAIPYHGNPTDNSMATP